MLSCLIIFCAFGVLYGTSTLLPALLDRFLVMMLSTPGWYYPHRALLPNVIPPPLPPNQLPSEIVEFTKEGHFVGQISIGRNVGGAFGLAIARGSDEAVRFAAVNDDDNTIIVLRLNFGRFHADR